MSINRCSWKRKNSLNRSNDCLNLATHRTTAHNTVWIEECKSTVWILEAERISLSWVKTVHWWLLKNFSCFIFLRNSFSFLALTLLEYSLFLLICINRNVPLRVIRRTILLWLTLLWRCSIRCWFYLLLLLFMDFLFWLYSCQCVFLLIFPFLPLLFSSLFPPVAVFPCRPIWWVPLCWRAGRCYFALWVCQGTLL